MPVYLIATLDTKGTESAFVRDLLGQYGVEVVLLDASCLASPGFVADVPRERVFEAAGTSLSAIQQRNDRGEAVTRAAQGVAEIVAREYAAGRVQGVLGLGGSAGTTIATAAMRHLPIGVPKVMVSTLASGQVRAWVGDKDILMLNSVVDIAGINRISRVVLGEAARAMAGMVQLPAPPLPGQEKPLIAATMFGVTTPCVQEARRVLEAAGYEVLVFHATGNGGQAMESLIDDGLIAGVLDVTTTELADELVGGILSAGRMRLTAAGRRGIPQVISVGALDMVNFGPRDTVPAKFAGRLFYQHNPTVTLMRTTIDENRALGEEIGRKAATAAGPTTILLPLRGVSAIDAEGMPFEDPRARNALFEGIRSTCGHVSVVERDEHINDFPFARLAAETLLKMLKEQNGPLISADVR
jgi:uncharacterized protein (UPF0261 family)